MSWTELATKPGAGDSPGFVADNTGGKLYSFGGIDGGGSRTNDAYVYDPDTDAWSAIADMGSVRGDDPGGFEIGGLIYAFGGSIVPGESSVATAERYNPGTNTWANIANMPRARSIMGVGAISGGDGYAIGGRNFDGSASVAEADRFDVGAGTWDTPTSMPGGARMGIAAGGGTIVDPSGRIYVAGGITIQNPSTTGTNLARLERYEPGVGWATLASLPASRRYAAAGFAEDLFYVVAGLGETGVGTDYNTPQGDLFAYHPPTDTWVDIFDSLPVLGITKGAVLDNRFYALNGNRLFVKSPRGRWILGAVQSGAEVGIGWQ